jgi:hypothetical protein
MSMNMPRNPSPVSPMPAPDSASRSRNLGIAVMVSLVIVCVGLYALARLKQNDSEVGRSDYPVADFISAAQALEVEPVAEWSRVEGDGFSIYLPERLNPLDEVEFRQMVSASIVGSQGATMLMMAVDADLTQFGTNVMVSAIPISGDMSPGTYVSGVADEMKAQGYSIKDKSVYELEGRSVGRLIYEATTAQGHRASGVQFAYPEGQTIWVVTGTALSAELHDWLPVFEAIAGRLEFE